jgi:hypothetical protein
MNNYSFTISAISVFTRRKCIRVTEMAFVFVAIFECGRPTFISKKALYTQTVRQECLDGLKLQAEWTIGLTYKPEPKPANRVAIIAGRMRRAGFIKVQEYGYSVSAKLPVDEFDRTIALQVAKENGWNVVGASVEALV